MSKKGRQIFYVCIGSGDDVGEFVAKTIAAETPAEASSLFKEETLLDPREVLGPFYKKRTQVLETTRTLKFTKQVNRAIYDNWVVNAFMLEEPENQAYLVFIGRTDGKKIPFPKGTITVPVSELRLVNAQ